MRICLFTPVFLPRVGGTQYVTDALAHQFHAKGHHVVVLAQGAPVPLERPYRIEWWPRLTLPHWFTERACRHLIRAHRRESFDVFLVNYARPTGYAAVRLSQRIGVPTVLVSHGGDLYHSSKDRRRPHLWKRTRYAYNYADGLIAISTYINGLIRELNPDPRRIEIIPNGVDVADLRQPAERPADLPVDRPFCLCLGGLSPMKGFDDAIAAYAAARRQLGDLAMLIVGKGRLDAELRRQVADLGLQNDVFFMGIRTGNDKRWLLRHCQFGVMPSIEEGHPIVGLEFLAVGKPVVCSTNGAFDGMYDDGVNAIRIPARDRERLADALVRMAHADLRAMGEHSARRSVRYDWSTIADRYLEFMQQVISEKVQVPVR